MLVVGYGNQIGAGLQLVDPPIVDEVDSGADAARARLP